MSWSKGQVIDPDTGWQDVTVHKDEPSTTEQVLTWLAGALWALIGAAVSFVFMNGVVSLSAALPVTVWALGHPWWALATAVLILVAFGVALGLRPDGFDRWVSSPARQWWRHLRYTHRWDDVMAASGLTVKDARRRQLGPRLARLRQGRFADELTIKLPAGITYQAFCDKLDAVGEAFGARDARAIDADSRLPRWLRRRLPSALANVRRRPGVVVVRLIFGDALADVVDHAWTGHEVDLDAVPVGRREDGGVWTVSLLGTHLLLSGATGSGKGSVLWSLIASLAWHIRSGVVQVFGLDPKGGMELGYGRELFRRLVTMDGPGAELDAVELLEYLAGEADRRAALLAGHTRKLTPTASMPFLVIVIDELASITALLTDRALHKRAENALGRLLTKGRAPGVCLIGALQDPRKDVIKWRDLMPSRVALRLVEAEQVGYALGDGARARGARCDQISDATPGVGYVVDDGSQTVTRVRAAYLEDADLRELAHAYQPAAVLDGAVIEAGDRG